MKNNGVGTEGDDHMCPRTEQAIEISGAGAKTYQDVLKALAVNLESLCRQLEKENNELRAKEKSEC